MSLARLLVVEGPDQGAEIEVPREGAGIGRDEGNAVRLRDRAVSRSHATIELRSGAHVLLAASGGKGVRVNGRAIEEHPLVNGDEITLGRSRLVYVRGAPREAESATSITLELSSAALLYGDGERTGRARRHLGALARLGAGLRAAADRAAAAQVACAALREALFASRAAVLAKGAEGALSATASAPADPGGDSRGDLDPEIAARVLGDGQAVLSHDDARALIAAPIFGPGAESVGALIAERRGELTASPWDQSDLELVACAGHLVGAALDGAAAREALARENDALKERIGAPELVGMTPAAAAVNAFIAKVARTDSTVLVLGESGVGKELVAAAIHRSSKRARGPFVGVNCAALSESVLESELFGHEKGAFTGAVDRKIGKFEQADGGTIFLDEVGEIPARSQAKFLRVLEDRRLTRVGGARSIPVDVRVIAATNRDLEAMIRAGEFREDLFFRLSVIRVHVPPLRERAPDIPLIAQHLLARLRAQIGRRVSGFAPDALAALSAYAWPGNVRELRNAIEHALVLGEGEAIRAADLPDHVTRGGRPFPLPIAEVRPAAGVTPGSLRELEREGIVAALAATGGNKVRAAAMLGIDRSTLYKKLKEYGIAE